MKKIASFEFCSPVSLIIPGGAKQTGIRYSVTDMGADRSASAVQADPLPWPSHMVTIPSLPG